MKDNSRPFRQLRIKDWSRAGERRGVSPPVLPAVDDLTMFLERARVELSG
jgi:hypothetical protein